jgi:hypothetical protein
MINKPEKLISNWMSKINKNEWVIFCISILSGIMIHFQLLATQVTNPDVVWTAPIINGHAWEIALGRWGIPIIDKWRQNMVLPLLTSVVVIIILSIITLLFLRLFRIKGIFTGSLIAILIMAFPTFGETLTYFYCADSYLFSMLLSVIGVIIVYHHKKDRGIKSFLFATALFTISLGIYQSFIGISIAIVYLMILSDILFDRKTIKECFQLLVRFSISLLVSLGLYFIIANIVRNITHIDTASYRGMNEIGIKSLKELFYILGRTFKEFFSFFFGQNIFNNNFWYLKWLNIGVFIIITIIITNNIFGKIKKKRLLEGIILGVGYILIPVVFEAIIFIASDTSISYLMVPQMIFIYIWGISIFEENIVMKVENALNWLMIILLVLIGTKYIQIDNAMYYSLQISYDKTYSVANDICNKLQSYPDFKYSEQQIAILGNFYYGNYAERNYKLLEAVNNTVGSTGWLWLNDPLVSQQSWYYFIGRYKGITINYCNDLELLYNIMNSDEYKEMNNFPDDNSIKMVKGVLVVKLSN